MVFFRDESVNAQFRSQCTCLTRFSDQVHCLGPANGSESGCCSMWYTETGPPVGSHLKSKHAGSRVQTAHLGVTVCVAVRLLLQLLPLLAFLFLLFQLPFHLGCNVRSLGLKNKQTNKKKSSNTSASIVNMSNDAQAASGSLNQLLPSVTSGKACHHLQR